MSVNYSIIDYGKMISCGPRFQAYAEAIAATVRPGCTVIDIGAGFGIHSFLACQSGAGSVIAVEPSPSIELLPAFAAANGCADRIVAIRGLSFELSPAQPADVVVADLRGALPFFEENIPAIIDARERLLVPGGTLIPQKDTLRIAVVEDDEAYQRCEEPWRASPHGIDLSNGRRFAVNQPIHRVHLTNQSLISTPVDLFVLDYQTVSSADMSASIDMVAARSGTAHGLLIWFDADLGKGIGFSNAPSERELVYGQTFFPFDEAIHLNPGDCVRAAIRADYKAGNYVWTWESSFFPASDTTKREPTKSMLQSTFISEVFSSDELSRHAGAHIPKPNKLLEADLFCLSCFDGEKDLDELANSLFDQFPNQFISVEDALDYLVILAKRYKSDAPSTVGCMTTGDYAHD